MEFIFGIAIGFTLGFLVKHCIEEVEGTQQDEVNLKGYTAQEGAYNDDSD